MSKYPYSGKENSNTLTLCVLYYVDGSAYIFYRNTVMHMTMFDIYKLNDGEKMIAHARW